MGIQSFPSHGNEITLPDGLAELDVMNDGSDGAFNPVSNQTLTSGIYRFSSVNIPAGVVITPSSRYLIILCSGTLQVDGTITASGKGGAGNVGQAFGNSVGTGGSAGGGFGAGGGGGGGTSGNYHGGGGGGAGGSGGTPSGTSAGAAGSGAFGGLGATGGQNGFAGGNTTPEIAYNAGLKMITATYGAGGGGGGTSGSGAGSAGGGMGGAGGGSIVIFARNITGTGAVRTDGVAGTNGSITQPFTGAAAGGGGGGGGTLIAVAGSIASSVTFSTNGGAGGTPVNSGATGYTGGAGGNGLLSKIIR